MKFICIILLCLSTLLGVAQDESRTKKEKPAEQTYQINDDLQYVYERPKPFSFITNIPRNYANLGRETVKKENTKWLGLTIATTLLLMPGDEHMIDASQNLRTLGVTEKHEYKILFNTIDVPTNLSASMYHLGHGNTSLIVSGGFLLIGGLKKDYRAIHTSSEILEGIITLGIITQSMKRGFGRESPHVSTRKGGKWSSFPGWNEYMENTSSYDAMPSGHVATLTSTITILAKNYPNSKWIAPVGYSLIGVLSLEMMNSGVHWISDYPLGFLIGYSVGSVVANSKIKKIKKDTYSNKSKGFDTQLTFNRLHGDNLLGVQFTF